MTAEGPISTLELAQFMVIDPAGPALGTASTSPALEFVVGH